MKKIIISILVGVAAVILILAGGVWWFQTKELPRAFTQDAVGIIATAGSELFAKNPEATADDIDRMIKFQDEVHNLHLKVNSEGKAVDSFGQAFQVVNRVEADRIITTVISAGPDREFETGDDINSTAVRKKEPQGGAGQPATAPQAEPEGNQKPEPESEARPQ